MNYGQYETERRLKSLSSKTGKYTSKLVFNIFKAFFILFLFLAVAGAAVGFGMIKGIIDNAPSVDIMNIQPDRFATTVYDADGNLTETLVTSGSNRESAKNFLKIWSMPLLPLKTPVSGPMTALIFVPLPEL